MDKNMFLKELKKVTNYSDEECIKINDIVEDTFIVGRKNKDKMTDGLMKSLGISYDDADELYNTVISILVNRVKDRVKHPFKNDD